MCVSSSSRVEHSCRQVSHKKHSSGATIRIVFCGFRECDELDALAFVTAGSGDDNAGFRSLSASTTSSSALDGCIGRVIGATATAAATASSVCGTRGRGFGACAFVMWMWRPCSERKLCSHCPHVCFDGLSSSLSAASAMLVENSG